MNGKKLKLPVIAFKIQIFRHFISFPELKCVSRLYEHPVCCYVTIVVAVVVPVSSPDRVQEIQVQFPGWRKSQSHVGPAGGHRHGEEEEEGHQESQGTAGRKTRENGKILCIFSA